MRNFPNGWKMVDPNLDIDGTSPEIPKFPTLWAAHWRNIAVLWDTTPKLWKPSKLHDKDSAIPIVRSFLKWIGSLSELYR